MAIINAVIESDPALFNDAISAVLAPNMLQDVEQVRACGIHSGIPRCCVEHFIATLLPNMLDGRMPPSDDAGYARCPRCRRADRRVAMRPCSCFVYGFSDSVRRTLYKGRKRTRP